MFTLFEAEFGDIKVSRIHIKSISQSRTEENEFFVRLWDEENLLTKPFIPKGSCRIIQMVKIPVSCPHCHQELPLGEELKEFETHEYKGATVKGITKIADDAYCGNVIELRIHYEEVEHVTKTQRIG